MFAISIKRYLKTPVLILLTVLWFVFFIHGLLTNPYGDFIYDEPRNVLEKVQVSFLFFLFVSYIYQSKSRQAGLDETVAGVSYGMLKQVSCQLVFLAFFALAVSIGTFAFLYWKMSSFQLQNQGLEVYLLKLVFIHQFLPHIIAVLLGLAISGFSSKAAAYCVLVGIYILLSRGNIAVLDAMLMEKSSLVRRIPRLFNLYSQDYDMMNNAFYIFPVENVNIWRVFAWIGIVLAIVLHRQLPHGKKHFSAVFAAAGLVSLVLYLLPSSEICLGGMTDDYWLGDSTYYMYTSADSSRDETADFKLTFLQADFTVKRLLDAKVTVAVDMQELPRYRFTLYHDYHVKKVENQSGKKLKFYQDGDYLTVDSHGEKISELTFYYSGFHPNCYSSPQGIFLPGYLEYYPMPGFHTVYIQKYGYYGYTMEGFGYDVDCDITVHTKQNVYSNLPSDKKNHFQGKCDSFSLYAGIFMKEKEIEGCRILYSPVSQEQREIEKNPGEYKKFIRWYEEKSGERPQLWCLSPGGNSGYYFGKDQLMGDILPLKDSYERYLMTGDWYQIFSVEELREIEKTMGEMQENIKQMEEEENDRD